MLAIHAHPAPQGPWKSVEDLAQGFARYRKGPAHPLLDPALVDRAEKTFLSLCATQSEPRLLLHGDLHHMNILKDDARGWLVIDPKGVVGELAYEPAAILHNPIPSFEMIADAKIMESRVRIFSDRLGTSAERILGWCFAKNILGHLWTVEDRMDTSTFPRSLRVAQTALELLGR
jgi:streptomycin 6-kinase